MLMAKLGASALLLGWVLAQLDWNQLLPLWQQTPLWVGVAAFGLLHAAQLASSQRMRLYLAFGEVTLSTRRAIWLYYQGMLYNTLLPGGIGGDGLKLWWLKSRHQLTLKRGAALLLAERGNGLLLLLASVGIIATAYPAPPLLPLPIWLVGGGMCLVIVTYRLAVRRLIHEPLRLTLRAGCWSALVQGLNLALCALLAWHLGGEAWPAYLLLYQLAAIASLLPVSFGGVGIREAVFLYGTPLLGGDPLPGVALSLISLALYLAVAACALPFSVRNHPDATL
jgi:uncharacterized membrane protein YbhN (UPF0104 family)